MMTGLKQGSEWRNRRQEILEYKYPYHKDMDKRDSEKMTLR